MTIDITSHRSGSEVVPQNLLEEISSAVLEVNADEKQISITPIKDMIKYAILRRGWTEKYKIDIETGIYITFIKGNTGLCIQTGNYARTYADLLKLQALYIKGKITCGIIVVPTREYANKMANNMANADRLISELKVFDQVITMPIIIVGFGG